MSSLAAPAWIAGILLVTACTATRDAPRAVSEPASLTEIAAIVCDDEPESLGEMAEPLPVSGGDVELIPYELERCTHAGEQTLIEVYKNKAQQVRMLMEIGFIYAPTPATPGSLQEHPYVCGDYYAVVVEEMDTRDRLLEALDAEMCP